MSRSAIYLQVQNTNINKIIPHLIKPGWFERIKHRLFRTTPVPVQKYTVYLKHKHSSKVHNEVKVGDLYKCAATQTAYLVIERKDAGFGKRTIQFANSLPIDKVPGLPLQLNFLQSGSDQ